MTKSFRQIRFQMNGEERKYEVYVQSKLTGTSFKDIIEIAIRITDLCIESRIPENK